MLVAVEDDVLVNLVADHQHVIPAAQLQNAQKLRFLPDMAHGVVRGAQQQHFHMFVLEFCLQVGKIHGVAVLRVNEVAANQAAPSVLHRVHEGVVAGGEDGYAIAGGGQGTDGPVNARNHAGGEAKPLPLGAYAVAGLLPGDEGILIGRGGREVAVNAKVHGLAQRLPDAGRGGVVHVCHPQGNQILPAVFACHGVPLDAPAAPALRKMGGIKSIVCHIVLQFRAASLPRFLFSITNLTKTAREFNENRRGRQKIMEQFSQRVYQNKTPYFSIRHRVLRLMPRRLAVWVWFMFSSS